MTSELRLHPDLEQLSHKVAEALATRAREAVELRGRFTLALAGGSTPRLLYTLLAGPYASDVPWPQTHLFWGDERYVPHTDEASNYRMAREALIDHVPVPPDHIHPMPTHYARPGNAARVYAQTLTTQLGPDPRLDLILLGLGDDGHTASLFPGSPALQEHSRLVVTATSPAPPHQRLTCTFPLLNRAAEVFFLVSGAEKGPALQCAFGRPSDVTICPAGDVSPDDGAVTWWVDEAAMLAM